MNPNIERILAGLSNIEQFLYHAEPDLMKNPQSLTKAREIRHQTIPYLHEMADRVDASDTRARAVISDLVVAYASATAQLAGGKVALEDIRTPAMLAAKDWLKNS